ncbi:MAG: Cof-type HAD-IIB family hydrolase [Clostridia bacterium]|nr:Cof-type HAD-IIB family hydrolase [Clostridia bacterium]
MIKLIASDLDGTLLPPSKGLPEETFSLIEKLYERGIIFVPASGRQLPNLEKLFAPVLNKIAIIAENGGLCSFGGKIIFTDPTPRWGVKYALDIIRGEADLYPLLSCAGCAYYESDFAPFIQTAEKSYSNIRRAKLDEVAERETVLKISVWDGKPPCAEHGGKILPPQIKGLRTMVSGFDWLDVSAPDANKGKALRALMQAVGASADECVAFGDHMNDLEMLQSCGQAYVTANAFAGLKAQIKNEVPSNADFGVIKKIKEILNG